MDYRTPKPKVKVFDLELINKTLSYASVLGLNQQKFLSDLRFWLRSHESLTPAQKTRVHSLLSYGQKRAERDSSFPISDKNGSSNKDPR